MTRSWLADVGHELAHHRGVEIEYSVRLADGRVSTTGRCTCWTDGGSDEGAAVHRLLKQFGAPAEVLAEQAAVELPVRQGIGIDVGEAGPEHRLYLHGRTPATLADHYRAWRWRPGGGATASVYSFHFGAETASGLRPADLVPVPLRAALELLLADEQFRQSSGFWLRKDSNDVVTQVNLIFPWHPLAGSLAGLAALARQVGVFENEGWHDLPIRHLAVTVGPGHPAVTLYVSAPVAGSWPSGETEMREQAQRGAAEIGRGIHDSVYDRVPPPSTLADMRLDGFYGGDPASWRHILGPRLHYHHGLFDAASAPGPDAALDRAVTELYPFIPPGSRLYDIGCGWGGALAMWIRDLGCRSLGLTISRDEFRYVAAAGLPVRWGDAEQTLPPGYFDCAVLLESLEHMRDKQRLLRVLRIFAGRLVMRVNCQDGSAASPAFGGTMHMISSDRLRRLIEATGWRIVHWQNRRAETLTSVAIWNSRVGKEGLVRNAHIDELETWSTRVLAMPGSWTASNPLIEVVAVPAND